MANLGFFPKKRRRPLSKKKYLAATAKILAAMESQAKPFVDISADATNQRKKRGRDDFEYFKKTYLPHYFGKPSGELHGELHSICRTGNKSINAVAFPREHGKSVNASFAELIHKALYLISRYSIVISDTYELAEEFVSFVKYEFENNERIIQDFGDMVTIGKWEAGDFVVGGKARIRGMGAKQKVRGTRFGQYRPMYIVCDDLENNLNVKNKKLVKSRLNWLLGAVYGSMDDNGTLLVIGTMLAKISVLSLLVQHIQEKQEYVKKEFGIEAMNAIVYAAIKKDGTALWPEGKSLKKLKQIKFMVGDLVWAAEFMNDPIDTGIFKEKYFSYYVPEIVFMVPKKWAYSSGTDPSVGDGQQADWKSHVVTAKDIETKKLYVADVWAEHCSIYEMDMAFMQLYAEYKMAISVYEINGYQRHIKASLDKLCLEHGIYPNIQPVTHTSDKVLRIGRLQMPVQLAHIKFIKDHPGQILLREQMNSLGTNANDDVADAFEMSVFGIENWGGTFNFRSSGSRSSTHNRSKFGSKRFTDTIKKYFRSAA